MNSYGEDSAYDSHMNPRPSFQPGPGDALDATEMTLCSPALLNPGIQFSAEEGESQKNAHLAHRILYLLPITWQMRRL